MEVLNWPIRMPNGDLFTEGKAACDHGKNKVIDSLGSYEQITHISLFFGGTSNSNDGDNADFRGSRWQVYTSVTRLYDTARGEPLRGIYRHHITGVGAIFRRLGEPEYLSTGKAFTRGYGWRCV